MALQKFTPKAGVNRENTRLFNEGGWWESDKVRFRQGTPEKIGGWERISQFSFLGVCRSIWTWATLLGNTLSGIGTHLKFYIEDGGAYRDATPARAYATYSGPFSASGTTVTVTAAAHGASTGDFVTFYGALALSTQTFAVTVASPAVVTLAVALANGTPVVLSTTGALPTGLAVGTQYFVVNASGLTCNLANNPSGAPINTSGAQSGTHSLYVNSGATAAVLNTTHQIAVVNVNSYTFTIASAANGYDTGNGGTVNAVYDITAGSATSLGLLGWGAGTWGAGTWGVGVSSVLPARIWNQANFGQDLLYGFRGGPLYYWNAAFSALETANGVSVTIAAPAVVTLPTIAVNNTALVLVSTGALPTGLTIGAVYYVINASGSTCNLAATPGGAAVNTTGTQSGTHYIAVRGLPLSSLAGASDVPLVQNYMLVSDASRFVLAFGVNPIGTATVDPMFIRWSAQESAVNWTPAATNQAGGIRLSHGSKIVTAMQTRQEIVVWTDAALYSMQYLGPPYVWGQQLLADNVSIAGPNCAAVASGVVYWMGIDKFYKYDGRAQTLRCDLRQYIYSDINLQQTDQFFAGTNEGFNEVWWFYCSAASTTVDKYVVYNYVEDAWYYGSMARTAWIDSGLDTYPTAATYNGVLVYHEKGLDDNETGTPAAIDAYILSSEFDIGDGNSFGFVWRMLPDLSFRGSTVSSPSVTLTLNALQNSGSGYSSPASVGGSNSGAVVRTVSYPVEQFTGQVNVRLRGRQMSFKIESNSIGTTWQLGATRVDVRTDGKRGG